MAEKRPISEKLNSCSLGGEGGSKKLGLETRRLTRKVKLGNAGSNKRKKTAGAPTGVVKDATRLDKNFPLLGNLSEDTKNEATQKT